MREERYVLSKAQEVFDEEQQETVICPVKRVSTSTSLHTAMMIANNAHYDSVISEKKSTGPLSGRRKLV